MGKRWVLTSDLKLSRVGADLIWFGKLFHKMGAAATKARSALVFSLVLGTFRRSSFIDLSCLAGV